MPLEDVVERRNRRAEREREREGQEKAKKMTENRTPPSATVSEMLLLRQTAKILRGSDSSRPETVVVNRKECVGVQGGGERTATQLFGESQSRMCRLFSRFFASSHAANQEGLAGGTQAPILRR